jgi:membrane protein YqaA with SNARE-associated domain
MILLTVVAVFGLQQYEAGSLTARSFWLLALGLFYMSLCCVFFPAPTAWIVMLLASNEMQIIEAPILRVVIVSAACATATGMANLNEYHLITYMLRHRRIARVRDTRLYRWAVRWFARAPFMVVAVFGFVPLPVDVVRWLAIIYRYSRLRYFAAYVVGRFPRYVIYAAPAVWLDLKWWQILLIQAVLAIAAITIVLHSVLRRRQAGPTPAPDLAETGQMP